MSIGKCPPKSARLRKSLLLTGLLTGSLIGGCGDAGNDRDPSAPPPLTAATLGEQSVLAHTEYLASAPYADADLELGERAARVCRACHTLDAGGVNMLGPNLHGFFGRAAGGMPGFQFSEALKSADFVWTPRALDAWLQAPARFLPGNRMAFAGVADEPTRNALIAYLLKATTDAEAT